jgi:hypothetical protein
LVFVKNHPEMELILKFKEEVWFLRQIYEMEIGSAQSRNVVKETGRKEVHICHDKLTPNTPCGSTELFTL